MPSVNANDAPAQTKVLNEATSFVTAGALASKPDIIVKLNPDDKKHAKTAEEHLALLRARGFVVPVMQPEFLAVHMGPKLVARLAKQLGPDVYKSMNKVSERVVFLSSHTAFVWSRLSVSSLTSSAEHLAARPTGAEGHRRARVSRV